MPPARHHRVEAQVQDGRRTRRRLKRVGLLDPVTAVVVVVVVELGAQAIVGVGARHPGVLLLVDNLVLHHARIGGGLHRVRALAPPALGPGLGLLALARRPTAVPQITSGKKRNALCRCLACPCPIWRAFRTRFEPCH
jgi:hypothetical protein